MPISKQAIHRHLQAALVQVRNDALVGWAELLQLGRILLPHLGGPRTDYWWDDRRISEIVEDWKDVFDSPYPWRDSFGSPGRIALDSGWLDELATRVGPPDWEEVGVEALAVTILAAIDFADEPLRDFIQTRLRNDLGIPPCIGHAERCGLVPLPSNSWWRRPYRPAANPALGDRLRAFALPELPVKVFSRSAVGLDSGFGLEGTFRVRLLRVDAPLNWFTLDAVWNRTTGQPAFVADFQHEAWQRAARTAMESGWLCEADVTVLPEMVVSEELWRNLQKLHKDQHHENLVVAGSGHVQIPGQLWTNRSALICTGGENRSGDPVVSYLKSYAFALRQHERGFAVWSARASDDLRREAEKAGRVLEALEAVGGTRGWPLVCIDSPWGRLAIAICRDLLIDAGNPLISSLIDARVDHLLVPSYNPGRVSEFERTANVLRWHGIATFLIDGCPDGPATGVASAVKAPWLVELPQDHGATCTRDSAHGLESRLVCLERPEEERPA